MEHELPYDRAAWARWHQSTEKEHDYWIEQIVGDLPGGLEGTWFRNGPGLLGLGEQRFHHPFDGDGMIARATFTKGRVHFKTRFIQTEGFKREQAAGKILFRGVFGTQKPGGVLRNAFDLRFKNVANTNVVYWNGKLYCLWEGAEPYVVEPTTLETLGIDRLNGALKQNQPFSAHPKIDLRSADTDGSPKYVSFSAQIMGPKTKLVVFEFSSQFGLLSRLHFDIPGIAIFHDFLVTENFYLFVQGPLRMNPIPYVLGLRAAAQCLNFQTEKPAKVIVIPRSQQGKALMGAAIRYFDADSCFIFHHVMAREQDDGIRFYSVAYPRFQDIGPDEDFRHIDFTTQPPSQLWRFDIRFSSDLVDSQRLHERVCEFPFLFGYPHNLASRYAYFAAARTVGKTAPLQALMRYDFDEGVESVWCAEDHQFLDEPVYAPHRESHQSPGWVLNCLYDGKKHRTEILIFEADRIASGPVARIPLRHHLPLSLHGSFVRDVFCST